MTLAFIFSIEDAWVVVADKRDTSYMYGDGNNKIPFFSDNVEKIKEIDHNLFFIGAGNQDILDKSIELINSCNDFNEFNNNIEKNIDALYGQFGTSIDLEEFIVIDQKMQKAFKFKVKDIKEKKKKGKEEIKNSSDKNFIGNYENCKDLGVVKINFSVVRKINFNQISTKFCDFCNSWLSLLSIDSLDYVGHPAIHGSDIWVISKDKIRKIVTYPKNNYEYGGDIKND